MQLDKKECDKFYLSSQSGKTGLCLSSLTQETEEPIKTPSPISCCGGGINTERKSSSSACGVEALGLPVWCGFGGDHRDQPTLSLSRLSKGLQWWHFCHTKCLKSGRLWEIPWIHWHRIAEASWSLQTLFPRNSHDQDIQRISLLVVLCKVRFRFCGVWNLSNLKKPS